MTRLRVAAAQIALVDGDYAANLASIGAAVATAGPDHDLLVLPETATSGFASRDDVERLAEPLDGPTVARLRDWSRAYDLTIACGLAERDAGRLFNTAVVVADGAVQIAYRKTQLWVGETGIFTPGDTFGSAAWHGTRIGALICFDVEFPETARAVAVAGARVIAVCNGNMAPFGPNHRIAACARAMENQAFLVMCNRVGQGRIDSFAGGSLIVDPAGRILAEADGASETLLSAEIGLNEIETARHTYDYLQLRRIAFPAKAGPPGP
ncbi:nitrilase-related carbon-nitrogen hydrolase [Sphingomonas flavalba]|uniref:nitrilase-related carbon-nitrogen hydrolase n=1 Tax=Sphingomonas flavalba TaxID=2559804 RepID=UPI0039DF3827